MQGSTEYEATLAVYSTRPLAVIEKLAQIETIGGLRLSPGKSLIIRDVYLDTPAGELSAHQDALRIRRIGPELLITLKGPTSATEGNVAARAELELPWSRKALTRVEEELATYGLSMHWAEFSPDDPITTLVGSGFHVIQDRTVHRITRDVIPESSGLRACEMLIDSVTYRLPNREIAHREVEVEAQGIENVSTAEILVTNLTDRFGGTLRPWDYGKLATGLAVEEMLKLDSLENAIDAHGCLLPRAYDLILSYLRRSP